MAEVTPEVVAMKQARVRMLTLAEHAAALPLPQMVAYLENLTATLPGTDAVAWERYGATLTIEREIAALLSELVAAHTKLVKRAAQ